MMMKFLVNIDVPDLEAAVEFYTSALDLKFNRIIDGDVAELTGAECRIYFLRESAGTKPAAGEALERHYARHWTPVHMDFVVEDLESASARAIRAGARREIPARHWRGATHMSFSDPFGHGFCLIAFKGDTYESDNHGQSGPAPEAMA